MAIPDFFQSNMLIVGGIGFVIILVILYLLLKGQFTIGIRSLLDAIGDKARENIVKLTAWAILFTFLIVLGIMGLGFLFSGFDNPWLLWDRLGLPFGGS